MGKPVVAIVGRPNVGKSTLFNRLIGKRKAIVDDAPGITRDRNYDVVQWNNQEFELIDTGGYVPESRSRMDAAIREQVEIAIAEADLVLLVVDAVTGITDVDEVMADMLRKAQKDTLVVVNKVDDQRMDPEVNLFYALGLGDPQPVSGMTGRQSGDLLDVIIQRVKKYETPPLPEDVIKLAIVGRENVGKSSLVNTLLEKNRSIVTDIPGTTRDPVDSLLNYQKRKYLLIDTAGLKRKKRIKENVLFYSNLRTFRSMDRADVVLYLVDVAEGISRYDVAMLNEAVRLRKGIVLVLNKWDLIPKDHKTIEEYREKIANKLGMMRFIPQIYVSVHNKQRLYKMLDLATRVYEQRKVRIATSELNDYLLPIIEQHSPPASYGKEIKINYVTQAQANPPLFAFFCNKPRLIAEHYKRFLENKIRERYGFEGVPLVLSFREKHTSRNES